MKDIKEAMSRVESTPPRVFSLSTLNEQVEYYKELDENDKYFNLKRSTIEYKITLIYIGLVKGLKVQYYTEMDEGKSQENALYKLKKDLDLISEAIESIESSKEITYCVINELF